jgi:hypothetical protein
VNRVVVLLGLVLVCGCAVAPGNLASATRVEPTPLSGGPPYAVLVDELSQVTTYKVSVVGGDGHVVAAQEASKRSAPGTWVDLPYVSTTSTSLYILDGDSKLEQLPLDGTGATTVATLPVSAQEEAGFAVSPDDSKIAVSVLDFNASKVRVTLYVSPFPTLDLQQIFQSDSDYVWPVAWHGGLLVLAHAYGAYKDAALKAAPARDNPYWAISYHLVDPANANRVVLMGSCTVSGPLSPAGSACIQGGAIDWQGNTTAWSTHDWGAISAAASISPDGSLIAAADPDHPENLDFWRPGGAIATWVEGPDPQEWAGWIDDTHVFIPATSKYQPRILTLSQGPSPAVFVEAQGFYAARLPTDIT